MTLLDEAAQAELIADALASFRASNPEHVQDVNAVIAESNLLGSSLRQIQPMVEEDPDVSLHHIEDDLKLVHRCIMITLRDVWRKIGLMGGGRVDLMDFDYQQTWREIVTYCQQTGPTALSTRLQDYRLFVTALRKTLRREIITQHEYADLRHKVKLLDIPPNAPPPLRISIGNVADDALVQQSRSANKQLSFERVRAPLSPAASDENRPRFPLQFFPNPTPPMSPPTTISSLSQASSNDQPPSEHWARVIFRDVSSSTLLAQNPREDSKYHGPDHPTHEPPSSRYVKALEMTFPPKLGAVSLHFAPSRGMRAKMVVDVPMSRGQVFTICLPMDRLEISREGCMLRFCRTDGRNWLAWVSLNFSTIERLILFACTFVAMRSAGGKGPKSPIWHDQNQDEVEVHSAVCINRRSTYILSVFWDKPSRSVRLQATIRGGHMQGTPIWTAWITHEITSPVWCQQLDRKMVLLRSLHPYIFSLKDELERVEDGSYCLNFDSSSDTKHFLAVLKDLGRNVRRGRGG